MVERQNVIATVAIIALMGLASWVRPDPPPSFHAELARVAAEERELLNRYKAASVDFEAGRIDDPAFAEIVEREILRPYADVQREIEELKAHPDAEGEFVAQLIRFAALRADGWTLLVEALREQDHEKLRRYEQKSKEAEAIARKLLDAHGSEKAR